MPEPILKLEEQGATILAKISTLGDFRKGSITAISGRCGKKNCRCHQPNQPGHGPTFRLTCKVNDKTISESFSSPAAFAKGQREVNEFHRFQQLSKELLEVNEKICRSRPVEESLAPRKKNSENHPPASSARNRATISSCPKRLRQVGAARSGGSGDVGALHDAQGGRIGFNPLTAGKSSGNRSPESPY